MKLPGILRGFALKHIRPEQHGGEKAFGAREQILARNWSLASVGGFGGDLWNVSDRLRSVCDLCCSRATLFTKPSQFAGGVGHGGIKPALHQNRLPSLRMHQAFFRDGAAYARQP